MKHYDAIVIGGGILGCFAARNLRRWNISVLLIEAGEDVCTGITRANSAIVYPGYDNRPGSLKARMTVRANAGFDILCRDLDVPFQRCGSLLVTYDEATLPRLEKKLRQGIQNGVPGLRLLTGQEAEALEPMLRKGVAGALYAPSTGTVNPWQLGIAAYENAVRNGAEAVFNTRVQEISQSGTDYLIHTDNECFSCHTVLNCAGLYADRVQELLFPPTVRLHWDGAEYLVLDPRAQKPERIIFLQAQQCGKGITAIPCVEGNLLVSGTRKPMQEPFATTYEGLEALHNQARELLPQTDLGQVIRSFGAVRPNPYVERGDQLPDFCIERPGSGFFSLIGIKTPGLTCANELGSLLAEECAQYLNAQPNPDFDPTRKGIRRTGDLSERELARLIETDPDYGRIVCQCMQITAAEVKQAIARGAVTADGVKRRLGTGMGRCQGSRCRWEIEELIRQSGRKPTE